MKLAFVIVNFHSDEDSLSIIKDLVGNAPVKDVVIKIYAVDNSNSIEFKKYPQVIHRLLMSTHQVMSALPQEII